MYVCKRLCACVGVCVWLCMCEYVRVHVRVHVCVSSACTQYSYYDTHVFLFETEICFFSIFSLNIRSRDCVTRSADLHLMDYVLSKSRSTFHPTCILPRDRRKVRYGRKQKNWKIQIAIRSRFQLPLTQTLYIICTAECIGLFAKFDFKRTSAYIHSIRSLFACKMRFWCVCFLLCALVAEVGLYTESWVPYMDIDSW